MRDNYTVPSGCKDKLVRLLFFREELRSIDDRTYARGAVCDFEPSSRSYKCTFEPCV